MIKDGRIGEDGQNEEDEEDEKVRRHFEKKRSFKNFFL
jgi:hypothetical protein